MASVEQFLLEHSDEEIFIECPPERHGPTFNEILKAQSSSDCSLIILCTIRPSAVVRRKLEELKIDTSHVSFVDCISLSQGVHVDEMANVSYVENLSSLTDISIAIHVLRNKVKTPCCILIDSLATLLIYNPPLAVTKFVHMLLTTVRITNDHLVLLNPTGGIPTDMHLEIVQLCDAYIKLDGAE